MGPVARVLVIAVVPSAVLGAALWLPRGLRAAVALVRGGREAPAGPPLERTAADLRRLMAEHETVLHSPELLYRGARLAALEGAITDSALEAARALGVPAPVRAGRAPLGRRQLALLLDRLVGEGLVLPQNERFDR